MVFEVDAMLEDRKTPPVATKKSTQMMAAISVSLVGMTTGCCLAWSAPCLAEFEDRNCTTPPYHLNTEEGSWAGSIVTLGALLAAIPTGYFVDIFGRKFCLLSLFVPFSAGFIMIAAATSPGLMYAGRLLGGLGTGASCVLIPMYISEVTEPSLKGPLTSVFPLLLCTGVTLPFVLSAFMTCIPLTWSLLSVPILFLITFVFMPETPTYLIKCGKESKARKVLEKLRGKHVDLAQEISDIRRGMEGGKDKLQLMELFRDKVYFRSFMATLIMFCFQQLSGINVLMFYAVLIFKVSNSGLDPTISSIIIAVLQVSVTVIAIFVVDKLDRKTFIINSCAANTVALSALAFYFNLVSRGVDMALFSMVPLFSLILYIISFSLGLGPVPWVVVGEMLSPKISGTVIGISVTANWFCGFLATKCFAPLVAMFGIHAAMYTLAALNCLAMVLIYFFVPETKGKTLLEVQEKLAK